MIFFTRIEFIENIGYLYVCVLTQSNQNTKIFIQRLVTYMQTQEKYRAEKRTHSLCSILIGAILQI